jgi:hypothetical protein
MSEIGPGNPAAVSFDRLFRGGPQYEAPCVFCQKKTRSHALAVVYAGELIHTFELEKPDEQLSGHSGRQIIVGIICHACWREHDVDGILEGDVKLKGETEGGPLARVLEAFVDSRDECVQGVVG